MCILNVDGVRADMLYDGLCSTEKVLKVFFVGLIASLCGYGSVPVLLFVFKGQFISLIPIEIIFIDQVREILLFYYISCDSIKIYFKSTKIGFLAANVLMVLLGIYALMSSCMYGSGFIIIVCNYSFLVNLIEQDLKDLDAMWSDVNKNQTTLQYRHAFLRNICTKVQDLRE